MTEEKKVYRVVLVASDDFNFVITYHVNAEDWKKAGEKAEAFIKIDYPKSDNFKIDVIALTDINLIAG